jgi:hypothetical protein
VSKSVREDAFFCVSSKTHPAKTPVKPHFGASGCTLSSDSIPFTRSILRFAAPAAMIMPAAEKSSNKLYPRVSLLVNTMSFGIGIAAESRLNATIHQERA